MKAYELKVNPADDIGVWRLVEISDRQNLHQLSQLIQEEFGLRGNHLYSFFMGEKPYNARVAYGGPNAGMRRLAPKTNVGSLGFKKGRKFLYVYDFVNDRSFAILVQRLVNLPDSIPLPRVTRRQGATVRPAPDPDASSDLLTNVRDIVGRVKAAATSCSQGKRPSKSSLRQEYELARELDQRTKGGWETIKAIERQSGADVSGWLIGLPEALVAEGLVGEALEIIEWFAGLEPVSFLGDRPFVLAKAGREEEAKREAEANTSRFPDDAWVWARTANLFWQVGDKGRAERFFRRALDLAGNTQFLRDTILERLLALLEEMGKSQAARELSEQERHRRARSERG